MIIELPTHLQMGVRKINNVPLNLNHYRNADFNQLNNMKILFDKLVRPKIKHLPYMEEITLAYRLYMPSHRTVDVSNVCCIVDKFFSDTLKKAGKIPDDNSKVISSISYHWGGVDKENPRVEVSIEGKKKPMKITTIINMSHDEIVEAIKDYCYRSGIRQESALEVDFAYNNSDVSYNAIITVGDSHEIAPTPDTLPEKPARRGPGRPPKAAQTEAPPVQKAEPEPEVEAPKHPEIEPIPMPSEETESIVSSPMTVDEPMETQEGVEEAVAAEMPEAVEQPVTEAPVAPAAPTKGLFPSKGAAPASTPAATPAAAPASKPATPAPAGKSLFSRLVPPKNDTK